MADSTSVNLFKLVVAALRAQPDRTKIVTDTMNFPSDYYVLQGAIDLLGGRHELVRVPAVDGVHADLETLAAAVDDRTALVTLSHVTFKSGYLYDMATVNRWAQRVGALTLWDLSHAAGAAPVALGASGADLAVGCTYKYLNGGPGSPAFLYVRSGLQAQLANPISGWFGQVQPFDFAPDYAPQPDLRRFLTGTPPVLSLLGVEPGVDMLLEAGMDAVRAKSVAQTDYLIGLWADELEPLGFRLNSPRDSNWRGSHVSLGHDNGLGIDLALIHEYNVLPDFREPDNIRMGIAPLYTTFADIYDAVARIKAVVQTGAYEKYQAVRPDVT